jgi:hypothetical protein
MDDGSQDLVVSVDRVRDRSVGGRRPRVGARADLIVFGIVLVLGAIFLVAPRVPFLGRLPGDFVLRRDHATIYIPLATCSSSRS